jgi:hypothetical protein
VEQLELTRRFLSAPSSSSWRRVSGVRATRCVRAVRAPGGGGAGGQVAGAGEWWLHIGRARGQGNTAGR